MEAVFRINSKEFDEELFRQIKNFLGLKNDLEITISIKEHMSEVFKDETREEYFSRISKARENLNNDQNSVSFRYDQLEDLEKSLLNES